MNHFFHQFILRRYKETGPIERKAGSGKKKGFKDTHEQKSIRRSIKTNPCPFAPKSLNGKQSGPVV